jgi:hypothetical protein
LFAVVCADLARDVSWRVDGAPGLTGVPAGEVPEVATGFDVS